MKVLIIGGVAGATSDAARLVEIDEKKQIIMFEREGEIYILCQLWPPL